MYLVDLKVESGLFLIWPQFENINVFCKCMKNDGQFKTVFCCLGCALSENKQTVPVSRSSGESVLLSCTCTDLQDRPERVQWRTPNHEDLLQRYSGRVQTFNQSSPGNLSVLISDLTEEDGGTYSCWMNQNQYRNFSLTVKGKLLNSDSFTFTHLLYETKNKVRMNNQGVKNS